MGAPAAGLEGWRAAVVAGGAGLLTVLLFVAVLSGFDVEFTAIVGGAIAAFLLFSLAVMWVTGAI